MIRRLIRICAGLVAALPWLYRAFIRPWHLRWGTTDEEAHGLMPGDGIVPHPLLEATRAVTIDAPPAAVWPWLVQMGYGRSGWYAYDCIDNRGVPSARTIVPELQDLKVGDLMPMGPASAWTVVALDPARLLVLEDHERTSWGQVDLSSVIRLEPGGQGRSRMVMRLRVDYSGGPLARLYMLVFEPGDFVMMRRMMLGIKTRAEADVQQKADPDLRAAI